MRSFAARLATGLCALLLANVAAGQPLPLPSPTAVAPGVSLYHVRDAALVDPPAPVSIWLLRVDTSMVDLRAALSNDTIVDTETVPAIAARHAALAAINAGFFLLPAGDPAGVYKWRGQLVSDARRPRGAVGLLRDGGRTTLVYDQLAAGMRLQVHRRGARDHIVEIAAVDTTRGRGRVTLFTPAYQAHTGTAPGGLEWVLSGRPLRVTSGPHTDGRHSIPRDGYVLSFGGESPPPGLRHLARGVRVTLQTRYRPVRGEVRDWERADAIVGGAGLLVRRGQPILDWTVEQLATGFAEARHPRTMIGSHEDGSVWLVTVDGRQPGLSVGMTLAELRSLAQRLSLENALNLDGGGSTTMWVAGRVVNSPSDPAGLRPVSDALVVLPGSR